MLIFNITALHNRLLLQLW